MLEAEGGIEFSVSVSMVRAGAAADSWCGEGMLLVSAPPQDSRMSFLTSPASQVEHSKCHVTKASSTRRDDIRCRNDDDTSCVCTGASCGRSDRISAADAAAAATALPLDLSRRPRTVKLKRKSDVNKCPNKSKLMYDLAD